jgi:hypothetical protein
MYYFNSRANNFVYRNDFINLDVTIPAHVDDIFHSLSVPHSTFSLDNVRLYPYN